MLVIAGVWGFFIPYMINYADKSQPEYKYAKNVDIISPSGEASYRQVVTASPIRHPQYQMVHPQYQMVNPQYQMVNPQYQMTHPQHQMAQPIRVPTQQTKIKYHTHKKETSKLKVDTPPVSPIRVKPPRSAYVSVPRYQYQGNIQLTKPKKRIISPYAF